MRRIALSTRISSEIPSTIYVRQAGNQKASGETIQNVRERERFLFLHNEKVMVVPRSVLATWDSLLDRGFHPDVSSELLKSIGREGFFVPRHEAEHCSSLKQIILYLVMKHRQSLFVYQRVKETTETRLMHMYSIGLGGHINPVDRSNNGRLFSLNLYRELTEEVQFEGHFSYRLIGTVNDDDSEVGRYHLGLVYLVTCSTPEIRIRETNKLKGSLVPTSSVSAYEASMETWSALILPDVCRVIG